MQQSFSDDAEAVLTAFAQAAVDEERDGIVREALYETFWLGVRSGIVAAFFYSLILLGASLILTVAGVDTVEVPHKMFTYFHP